MVNLDALASLSIGISVPGSNQNLLIMYILTMSGYLSSKLLISRPWLGLLAVLFCSFIIAMLPLTCMKTLSLLLPHFLTMNEWSSTKFCTWIANVTRCRLYLAPEFLQAKLLLISKETSVNTKNRFVL